MKSRALPISRVAQHAYGQVMVCRESPALYTASFGENRGREGVEKVAAVNHLG